ncbi:MAG TPA: DUF169 domain-containing protein [Dehalococcoidia bacterium]|nr:DUF169 domain-containing protein [Dehalococcoidia bacterium]
MKNHQELAREFEETLKLGSCLIGVRYSDKPDSRVDTERKLAACEAIDIVRREKAMVNLSSETCSCIGGKYYLGLDPVPKEQIIKVVMDVHKMFASEQLARQFLDNVPPPSGRGNFVVIAPLTEVTVEPDLVLSVCTAEQANRIVSLLMYSGLKPFTYNLVSAGCTSLANPMVTGEIDINLITDHARRRVPNFASNELIVAMPFEKFKEASANIPYAGAVIKC